MRALTEEDTDVAELIDIDEFVGMVVEGEIDDSDGMAQLVYEEDTLDTTEFSPSDVAFYMDVPEDVTHILWFKS
jgi:hypothetical protein